MIALTATAAATAAIILIPMQPTCTSELCTNKSTVDSYINKNTITPFNQKIRNPQSKYIKNPSERDREFNKVEIKLSSYYELSNNWDGYLAVPPRKDVVKLSLDFLSKIKQQNFIVPTPMLSSQGEVGLYWENNDSYIEVGFDNTMLLSYLIDSPNNLMGEDDVEFQEDIPASIIKELVKFN